MTNVIASSGPLPSFSPLPVVRVPETWERHYQQVHAGAKLKLIEEVDILQDDIAGKRFTVSGPLNEELHGLHLLETVYLRFMFNVRRIRLH